MCADTDKLIEALTKWENDRPQYVRVLVPLPFSAYIDPEAKPKQIIKTKKCDAVLMSVWNTIDDTVDSFVTKDADQTYDEANAEIYWGYNNQCIHPIFPKETTNQYIYVINDANEISVRSSTKKPADRTARVFFSCYKFVLKEVKKQR